ncbi:MAG: tRNA 2-thiocytidine biosynthesis protein TtcA [Clostridia bacterium]|nr:tRNA 2-thiocytidine biosynthesis protein TtcA [Clostridia bacterium]
MQKMLSRVRKCVQDYEMISEGDRIAVGVSGGKDSLATLRVMHELSRFYPKKFEVLALTVDMGYEEMDFSKLEALCADLGIEYHRIKTDIKTVVFDVRKEENPCSLCANMRRGALYSEAVRLGCKKVAYGHHMDDAVNTFIMSLVYEGRISCFTPVTYLSRTDITLIRPMLYTTEAEIAGFVKKYELPVVHNPCPANGITKRNTAAEILSMMRAERADIREKIVGSMQRLPLKGWGLPEETEKE